MDRSSVFKDFGVGLIGHVSDSNSNAGTTIASKLMEAPQGRGTRMKWEQTM